MSENQEVAKEETKTPATKTKADAAKKASEPFVDIEELKKQAMQDALASLKKDLGITDEDIAATKAAKAAKAEAEKLVPYDLQGHVVRINGARYTGKGTAPAAQVHQMKEMISKKQQRQMNELIRREYQIEQVAGGGIRKRLVSQTMIPLS